MLLRLRDVPLRDMPLRDMLSLMIPCSRDVPLSPCLDVPLRDVPLSPCLGTAIFF